MTNLLDDAINDTKEVLQPLFAKPKLSTMLFVEAAFQIRVYLQDFCTMSIDSQLQSVHTHCLLSTGLSTKSL